MITFKMFILEGRYIIEYKGPKSVLWLRLSAAIKYDFWWWPQMKIVCYSLNEQWHDFQQCSKCDQQRLRPACTYAQTNQSLCLSLKHSMTVKIMTEHHLEFLSLKGVCTGLSEPILIKMPHRWKSHVAA